MVEGIFRDEVRRLIQHEEAQVLEVLPAPEYRWSHLAGAVSIPLAQLSEETAEQLDRARPVIAYCNDFQ